MTTNKHISTDLTTANANEAKKAQEWVRSNQSVKIGSKTVAGILSEVRTLISGTLNLAEKPGKLSNTQTDAIIAKIQEDAFAKKYIEKQLDHENNRTKKNVLEALDMYYEVRAYLGLVSYMSSTLESHGKKCEKAKTAFAAGDTSSIPQKHKGDFQEWKKELEKEKTKLETSFSMLPKVGQDRLNANYTQWLTESDLSSITGLPPAPNHTPPTNPNILSNRNIAITTDPHSEKIQGGINAGETLWMTKDGVNWSAVPVDASNNFAVPISETANGNYIYRFKTKNAAGVESGEETVTVDINVVAPALTLNQPRVPNITVTQNGTATLNISDIQIGTTVRIDGDVNIGPVDVTGNPMSIDLTGLDTTVVGTKKVQIILTDKNHSTNKTSPVNVDITINKAPLRLQEATISHVTSVQEGSATQPEITLDNLVPESELTLTDARGFSQSYTVPTGQTSHVLPLSGFNTSAHGNFPITITVTDPSGVVADRKITHGAVVVSKAPLSLNPVSIDTTSPQIERGAANPQIVLKDAIIGSRVRITDTTSKVLCDVVVNRLDSSGNFKVTLRGLDTRKVGPEDITIEAIDPNNLGNTESNDQTLNISEQKIKFTHPPKAALTKPGKQESGRSFSINLDDIIPGSKVQIKNSRIPGGVEEVYASAKTFAQSLYNIDTTAPSTGPEELVIQMIDPNDTTGTNKSVEIRLPFEIDSPIINLERPDIANLDKISSGDDIKFQMTNAVEGSEVRISGTGLTTTKRIDIPGGGAGDYELDLGIKATNPPFVPGKKYDFKVVVEDPKHRGKTLQTTVKIEIDYPELKLATPVISNATPVEVRQGAASKGFLNVTNAVTGAEYILVLPNGSEIPAGKATGATHAVSLNNLDISTVGGQTVYIKVKDSNHDTVPVLQSSVDIEVKKKVESPKHLPQPVFKTPADYAEGGGDIEIELLNAVTHSEVTVEYNTAGGRTTTAPLTVAADGNLKLPLAGFDAPTGTTNITVNYKNPVSGVTQSRTITMHVAPRPDIERPEGLQDENDINTKPFDVKIGKIKPGQTITIAGNTEMGRGAAVPATLRNNGGTYMLNIPAGARSIKQNYTVTVTDATGATKSFQIVVNVKVPPKANRRIDHHNFTHGCEHAAEHGTGHYRINGEAHPFDVTKSWGKYKTNIHGENFKAKTPELLYKAVKEHLDHHNQHEKDEYNAYWGLMPESSDHKKDGEHGKDHGDKDGKKDKEGGHEKGGHGDHGSESKGGKFIGAIAAVGKTAAWPAAGAIAGLGYATLYGGGAVFLGPAVAFGATVGAGIWAIRKLWQIKNGKKGGEGGGHGAH